MQLTVISVIFLLSQKNRPLLHQLMRALEANGDHFDFRGLAKKIEQGVPFLWYGAK